MVFRPLVETTFSCSPTTRLLSRSSSPTTARAGHRFTTRGRGAEHQGAAGGAPELRHTLQMGSMERRGGSMGALEWPRSGQVTGSGGTPVMVGRRAWRVAERGEPPGFSTRALTVPIQCTSARRRNKDTLARPSAACMPGGPPVLSSTLLSVRWLSSVRAPAISIPDVSRGSF